MTTWEWGSKDSNCGMCGARLADDDQTQLTHFAGHTPREIVVALLRSTRKTTGYKELSNRIMPLERR